MFQPKPKFLRRMSPIESRRSTPRRFATSLPRAPRESAIKAMVRHEAPTKCDANLPAAYLAA